MQQRTIRPSCHVSTKCGEEAIARLLIEAGAGVNARDEIQNRTPLHTAAWSGHEAVARALIEAGSDLDARECMLWTPLHLVAWNGRGHDGAALGQRRRRCHWGYILGRAKWRLGIVFSGSGYFYRGLKSQSRWPRLQLYMRFWRWRLLSGPRSRSLERRQEIAGVSAKGDSGFPTIGLTMRRL